MRAEPLRTCIGCRERRPKSALVRLARSADGRVRVDAMNRLPGRGAYVCRAGECAERVVRGGRLAHALRGACRGDATLVDEVHSAGRSGAGWRGTPGR